MIGKRFIAAWKEFSADDTYHDVGLSNDKLVAVSAVTSRYIGHWNDAATSLSKWILATLITLNSGGLFLLLNLGLHPYAVRDAGKLFFIGISCALFAAAFQFSRVDRMRNFAFRVDIAMVGGLSSPTAREYRKAFNTPISGSLAVMFAIFSLFLLFQAGSEMTQAMSPCRIDLLKESEYWGSYQIPGPRGSHRSCYFYDIVGVPIDPLERAHWEKSQLEKAKDKHPDGQRQ